MTPTEAAKVLLLAAAYDNRTFDQLTASAWADALDDLELADCIEGVKRYYRENRAWMMPADIREQVRQLIRERKVAEIRARHAALEAAETVAHGEPASPEAVRDYREQINEALANIGKMPADV